MYFAIHREVYIQWSDREKKCCIRTTKCDQDVPSWQLYFSSSPIPEKQQFNNHYPTEARIEIEEEAESK